MNEAEICALSRMLDRMDYYRLLRLERSAPASAVRGAFQKMRREFHPDAFQNQDEEIRSAVSRIAKRVNEAYQVLRDSNRRKSYGESLSRGELRFDPKAEAAQKDAVVAGGRTPKGKRFWEDAVRFEREGNIAAALNALKMGLTFEKDNPDFKNKLQDLRAKLPNKKNDFAIR